MRTLTTICFALILGALFGCGPSDGYGAESPSADHATAILVPIGKTGVRGTLGFARVPDGVRVTGQITGLSPGAHGFHVHEYGDLTDDAAGASAGGHFSPRGMEHGRPTAKERHVGDLGNIEADEEGVARVDITDATLRLGGTHSIVGRAVVVHKEADKFTQPSGDAGDRVAFGVIGIAKPDAGS